MLGLKWIHVCKRSHSSWLVGELNWPPLLTCRCNDDILTCPVILRSIRPLCGGARLCGRRWLVLLHQPWPHLLVRCPDGVPYQVRGPGCYHGRGRSSTIPDGHRCERYEAAGIHLLDRAVKEQVHVDIRWIQSCLLHQAHFTNSD